jgi:predicted NACHT family NTPase
MLLIVGEPGSGKTTALLELARGLIARAADPLQPVPVVLQLSTWTAHHGTLFDWLVDELRSKYFVGRDSARLYLRRRRLVLLLDSLDETNDKSRSPAPERGRDASESRFRDSREVPG